MTQQEFGGEMMRLHRGFHAENELTPERLKALFDGLGQHSVGVLREAVTAALREPKLPWFDRLYALVETAADSERAAQSRQLEHGARDFFAGPSEAAPEWVMAHHRAIILLVGGKREEAVAILRSVDSPAAGLISRTA